MDDSLRTKDPYHVRSGIFGSVKTVIDVGAENGEFTDICLTLFPDAVVYAIDGRRTAVAALTRRFPIPRVKALHRVVGDGSTQQMVEHGGSSCSHPGDDAVSVTFDELLSGIPHDPASTLLKCDIEGAEVYLTSAILARYLAYRVELHIDNSLAAVSPDVAWLQQLIPPLLSGGYCGLTPLYPIRIDGPSPSTMVRGYLIGGRLNALSCHE